MTPDKGKVQELLDEASRLRGAARAQFLDARCGGADDADLRREVESLLAALDRARCGGRWR